MSKSIQREKNRATPGLFVKKAGAALASLSSEDRCLVGVSGGRDSVALAHFLAGCGFRKCIVCHLDHGLRGRTGAADARFVAKLSERLGLRAVIEKTDVAKAAAENRQSLETAGRNARHAFFGRVAAQEKCDAVFLGHHADDQVETFLFRLFRGAGTQGLGGMKAMTRLRIGDFDLRIVRPLLSVWRSEIDDYLCEHRLRFREDETNSMLENTRSKLRHEILPDIEAVLGRDVRKSIWQAAEILRAQHEFFSESLDTGTAELSVPLLRALPEAQQSILIQQWLKNQQVPGIGFALVQAVRALLEIPAPRAKVNLPGGRHVRRREKKLFVE